MANNKNSSYSASPSRRPFMQLDLQNVPKNYNKVTFHQQCYRLVPDLSIEDSETNQIRETADLQWPANGQRRRRRLPEIPAGRKPLEKLWQKQIDAASRKDPLSVQTASTPLRTNPATSLEHGGERWIRRLSTNMLLEIETDSHSGKALSLKLINDEQEEADPRPCHMGEWPGSSGLFSPPTEQDSPCSFSTPRPSREQTKNDPTNASDSGVSSNLQSPTVSTNSESNQFSMEHCSNHHNITLPEATHRALHKFCARHSDELDLEIGDAVHVIKEYDDHWSEGVNIRTGAQGIFPASLITDIDYSEFELEGTSLSRTRLFEEDRQQLPWLNFRIKRERFVLDFLGSIEVNESKGEQVLNEAISRVSIGVKPSDIGLDTPCACILEVSDIGLRMMDDSRQLGPASARRTRLDYFFSLLQITYCGHRARREHHLFAFITRHPSDRTRFACHVFQMADNTREVSEAVGRAFHRFYNRSIETSLPLERV